MRIIATALSAVLLLTAVTAPAAQARTVRETVQSLPDWMPDLPGARTTVDRSAGRTIYHVRLPSGERMQVTHYTHSVRYVFYRADGRRLLTIASRADQDGPFGTLKLSEPGHRTVSMNPEKFVEQTADALERQAAADGPVATAACGPPCAAAVGAAVKAFQLCTKLKIPFVSKGCKDVLEKQVKKILVKMIGKSAAKAVLNCSQALPKGTPGIVRKAVWLLCG